MRNARNRVLMDGVQVPVVAAETEGRTGRIEGQRARTRECKLGCVFTQTTVDKDGWAIRDPDSTTYVGAIETAAEFGFRIYTEAWRRGWEWATIKVVMGDGAVWIWNLADQHFPGAIQIVDLYHAREHLWKIAALLHPHDQAAKKLWMTPMKDLLDDGDIEPLVTHLREIAAAHAGAAALSQELLKEAEYFATNADRMRYPEFREKGLFVGSGVIEAGCKSVIGSRLKRSGMRNARNRVLDCPWRQRHHRPALLPHQWEVRRLLGAGSYCLINPFFSLLCRTLHVLVLTFVVLAAACAQGAALIAPMGVAWNAWSPTASRQWPGNSS